MNSKNEQNISQWLYDPLLSETENCNNNNILRIWDCGKKRYIKVLE